MSVLTPELLERIHSRAGEYDRSNTLCVEDIAELREAGYLRPRSLLESVHDQRLLAASAPATALAINMHLVVTGIARTLAESGDASMNWVLKDAHAGELFAFGNSEPGNDLVMWDSLTTVHRVTEPVPGYAYTGTKIFTTLSPAWTRLIVFGKQTQQGTPRLVHGILTREDAGVRTLNDWDALGMRATASHSTVLENAVIPDERIVRFLPVGANTDPFIFALFANFLLLISAVYTGIADRALELGVAAARRRTSLKNAGAPYSADPDIRWRLADAALALDALTPQLDTLARDVDNSADHGKRWFRELVGVKHRSTEAARYVVDQALRVAGGSGYRQASELARLHRDVLAGIYHPSDTESVHATVASNLFD